MLANQREELLAKKSLKNSTLSSSMHRIGLRNQEIPDLLQGKMSLI